jgi:ABC-type nitrate/sulfonate/bicarbonate transport system substrate-binding protein
MQNRKKEKGMFKKHFFVFLFVLPLSMLFPSHNLFAADEALLPIRIGWQTSWATQGQVAVVLQQTDILEQNGLAGKFIGFSYGGTLNEGALAGEVDVIFTADQPACMLLAKGVKWKIIGRLIYNRVATIVPISSEIKTVIELKDKSIGIPFGAAAHRETLRAITQAGLDPVKDVVIQNIGIYEQMNIIQNGNNKSWGSFSAFATWDPPLAELEYAHKARAIDYGLVTAVIVMSEDFIKKNPDKVIAFLKAYITAFYYYSQNQEKVNTLFKEHANLDFDPSVLNQAASVEPNLNASQISDVDIRLSTKDIEVIQAGADFIYEQRLSDTHIEDVSQYIDQSYLDQAMIELVETGSM